MAGASEFDWERLPSEAVRAFARVLDGVGTISDEVALATLRGRAAVPDATFLAPRPMSDVALQRWLPRDAVALDRVYAAASTDTTRERADTKPRRLARLQKQRRMEKLMSAVLEALLAAGRATAPLADHKQLAEFMHVPTIGGEPYRLFPYQHRVVDQIRNHAKANQRLHGPVAMPTGSGKTKTVVCWLVDEQISAGRKVLWITHRAELLQQAARTSSGSEVRESGYEQRLSRSASSIANPRPGRAHVREAQRPFRPPSPACPAPRRAGT
jgi:hypothetical protein